MVRRLRSMGLSYREIEDETGVSRTSAWRYSKNIIESEIRK